MGTGSNERLLRAISEGAATVPQILAAFLFGSHAAGAPRPDSDIDVAVLLSADEDHEPAGEALRRVIAALAAHVAADRLDVVILNRAPPALAFQVLKHGRLAFLRDPVALHRFRVRIYSIHADYAPVERFFREVTRRRALEGMEHG